VSGARADPGDKKGRNAARWRWGFGIAVAAVLLWTGYRWLFPETAKAAAERLLGCLEAGDGDCFLPYVHPLDLKRNGVTAKKLSDLIAGSFTPARKIANRISPIRFDAKPDANYVRAVRDYTFANGQTITVTLTVHVTENGLTCSPVVWEILQNCLAYRVAQGKYPEGTPLSEKLSFELENLRPALESVGFDGCIRESAFGPYLTWSQLREQWLRQAAKRRSELQALETGH
jgi:hypothetical protein